MNTIWADRGGLHDELMSEGALACWLRETALVGTDGEVGPKDLVEAQCLREAFRALAAWVTDDDRQVAQGAPSVDASIGEINRIATASPPMTLLRRHEHSLERRVEAPGSQAMTALSLVAAEGIDLFTGEAACDLRACRGPGCVLYFVKQHPRRAWCSPGCGNRARVARHYRRTHSPTS